MKNKKGITLIALIITIIVLLILAGVSISMVVGENGILNRATDSSIATKFAGYKEEMEMNFVNDITPESINKSSQITVMGEGIKKYIPSMKIEDINNFGILRGKLYYLKNDKNIQKIAKNCGIEVLTSGQSSEEFILELEKDILQKQISENKESFETGIKLVSKSFETATTWKVVTEIDNGKLINTYGNGWYYIRVGDIIKDIGESKGSFLINNSSENIIVFDDDKHTFLEAKNDYSGSDDLLLNLQANELYNLFSSYEDSKETFSNDLLGDGVKFLENGKSEYEEWKNLISADGLDFNNGISLEITPNLSKNKSDLFKNGLTFEFSR